MKNSWTGELQLCQRDELCEKSILYCKIGTRKLILGNDPFKRHSPEYQSKNLVMASSNEINPQ